MATYVSLTIASALTILALTAHYLFPNNSALASTPWRLNRVATNHQIEGYVNKASFKPGDKIDFHISCDSGSFKADIFRMGWYYGQGAKLVNSLTNTGCQERSIPPASPATGLVSPEWPVTFSVSIPGKWQSGVYLARLTGADDFQNYIPFVIRARSPSSPYLFVDAINTEAAYNHWGGNSLYTGKTPDLMISRAVEVSLNRPILRDGHYGSIDGSGDFLRWEYPMIQFLEKYGYPCDYLTDVDIHEHPDILQKYKTVIIPGHNEYWSRPMLDGFKTAVKKGVNLAIFAANTGYRPIRYLPDPSTGQPNRIIVNYKSATLDPENGNKSGITVTAHSWSAEPLNQPISALQGIGYRNESYDHGKYRSSLVVNDDKSWILNGTHLSNGEKISGIVGYEYDRYAPHAPHPDNVKLIFHSPVKDTDGLADYADASYYKLPGGGAVFDAGTIDWTTGLDVHGRYFSPKLVKITRNILDDIGRAP